MSFRCPWHGILTVGITVILSLALSDCGEPERPTVSIQHIAETGDIDQLKRHVYWGTDVNAWNDLLYSTLYFLKLLNAQYFWANYGGTCLCHKERRYLVAAIKAGS